MKMFYKARRLKFLNILLAHLLWSATGSLGSRQLFQAPVPSIVAAAPDGALASLGPVPAYKGVSIIMALDLYGPNLTSFDLRQQELLLMVLNQTILDVEDDELQLQKVEEIFPQSGPASVTLYTGRGNSSPSSDSATSPARAGRKLLGARILLQSTLAQAGNSSDLGSYHHLQTSVRLSADPRNVGLLKNEVINAVNGPLLPQLQQEGIDVRYVALSSLTTDFGYTNNPGEPAKSNNLSKGVIAAIVVVSALVPVGVIAAIFLVRRKRRSNQEAAAAKGTPNGSESSLQLSRGFPESSDRLHAYLPDRLPNSRSGTPVDSLVSSSGSKKGKQVQGGNIMDPDLCRVPFEELQFSRVIGEGSFGRVFLGKWQETTVAIKILLSVGGPPAEDCWDLDDVSRLRDCSWSQKQQSRSPGQKLIVEELAKEATLMAKLRHPNIVMFLGAALDPPCVVTEFCARGSLLDVLHRARTNEVARVELDWRRRLRLALDAAKGMNYLHSRQPPILHRDLKSANLLVDRHWQAKVADFNLSRVVQPSAAISSLAATNPRWLPPEVLLGTSYSSPTDVYAFGIILWELISWEIPWKEETPWQVVIAVVDHDKRPEIPSRENAPGGYPLAWQEYIAVMESCWAKEASQRPGFEAIINTMRILIDTEDGLIQSAPVPEQLPESIENPRELELQGRHRNSSSSDSSDTPTSVLPRNSSSISTKATLSKSQGQEQDLIEEIVPGLNGDVSERKTSSSDQQ